MLEIIQNALLSFENYHNSIYKMETYKQIFTYKNTSKEDYHFKLESLDTSRTLNHNMVIDNVRILNRLCKQNNIPKVYDEIISTKQPYRRYIADAVLNYVENIINKRI